MSTFESVIDGKPITWTIDLSPALVREVLNLQATNLMDQNDVAAIGGELFVSILYIICREQIEQGGFSPVQFGASMSPDRLKPAAKALCQAIVEFKPAWRRQRVREFLTDDRPIVGAS